MTATVAAPAEATRGEPGAAPVPLRRNVDFRRLWIGQGISELGSAMSGVVFPLLLLSAGYSTSVVGATGTVILVLGILTQIPAGYVADRYDQRRLMLGGDLARAVGAAGLTVAAILHVVPLWLAFGVVILSQVSLAVFRPAESRALRRIVATPQLTSAVSANQARGYALGIAGPAVGGLLFTAGRSLPFAADTLTFVVSALLIVGLRTNLRPDPGAGGELRLLPGIGEGWRILWRDRFLRSSTLFFMLVNAGFSALMYVVILGLGSRGGRIGGVSVGIAITAASAAGLVGSLLTPSIRRIASTRTTLLTGPLLTTLALVGGVLTGSAALLIAAFAVLCFVTPVCGALLTAVRAEVVPEHVYGRVVSSTGLVGQALQPFAPLAAGLMLAHGSLATATAVLAVTFALVTGAGLLVPMPHSNPTGGRDDSSSAVRS